MQIRKIIHAHLPPWYRGILRVGLPGKLKQLMVAASGEWTKIYYFCALHKETRIFSRKPTTNFTVEMLFQNHISIVYICIYNISIIHNLYLIIPKVEIWYNWFDGCLDGRLQALAGMMCEMGDCRIWESDSMVVSKSLQNSCWLVVLTMVNDG